MKKYNIKPENREFKWGDMKVIVLGERGRGRYESLVPYHTPDDAPLLSVANTKTGKPKIVQSNEKRQWLARVSAHGAYQRNTFGDVYAPSTKIESIEIVAKGRGAYGVAGRISTWYEYLLKIPDNTFLMVVASGGSNGRGKYWLYFGESEVFDIAPEELDVFCEARDIEFPKNPVGIGR